MKSVHPIAVRDVLLLSLTAGGADAVGYLGLGKVFTSNMTGNVVLLGIYLGQFDWTGAARTLFVLAAFVLGVALGVRLSRDVAGGQDWILLVRRLVNLEKILLVLFAIGWILIAEHESIIAGYPLLALLATAMGLQSAALSRLNAPGIGTTAITGTITALVTGVSTLLTGRSGEALTESPRGRIKFQAAVLALYCIGAACSGFLILWLPWLAGCWPAAVVLLTSWGGRTEKS